MSAAGPAYSWKLHYHIRWLPKASLDWQAFDSQEDAEARARELVRPNESFTIETIQGYCDICRPLVEGTLRRQVAS